MNRSFRPKTAVIRRDDAIPKDVTILCPACETEEIADANLLRGARMIVCRNCGETWPAAPARLPVVIAATTAAQSRVPQVLEAERRPLVTYSDGVDKAWAAKMASDVDAEPRRRSRLPATVGFLASALFLTAFFAGREAAVASLPDLAGLYSAIGLPVNLAGLAIEGVAATRDSAAPKARVTVRGTIRNGAARGRPALALSVSLTDAAGTPIVARAFNPPPRTIAPGESRPFVLEFDQVPRQAARIVLRFRQPANAQVAASGGGSGYP